MQRSATARRTLERFPVRRASVRLFVYGMIFPVYALTLTFIFVALAGPAFVQQHLIWSLLTLLLPVSIVWVPIVYLEVMVRYHPEMQESKAKTAQDHAQKQLIKLRRKEPMSVERANSFLIEEQQSFLKLMDSVGFILAALAAVVTLVYTLAIGFLARIASIDVLTAVSLLAILMLFVWFYVQYKRSGGSLRVFLARVGYKSRTPLRH